MIYWHFYLSSFHYASKELKKGNNFIKNEKNNYIN